MLNMLEGLLVASSMDSAGHSCWLLHQLMPSGWEVFRYVQHVLTSVFVAGLHQSAGGPFSAE